jgi:hypothetical protein
VANADAPALLVATGVLFVAFLIGATLQVRLLRAGSIVLIVVTVIMLGVSPHASAQTVGDMFRTANVSVVVIRAKG